MWRSGPLRSSRVVLMPRSNRPKRSKQGKAEEPDINRGVLYGVRRTEIKRGVEYTVQTHSGSSTEESKTWVCPYCSLRIGQGTGQELNFVFFERLFGKSKAQFLEFDSHHTKMFWVWSMKPDTAQFWCQVQALPTLTHMRRIPLKLPTSAEKGLFMAYFRN